jgi:hypothetical protein
MAFHIACPSCQQILTVDDEVRGKVVACSKCGKKMRVPAAAAEAQTYQLAPPPLPADLSRPDDEPIQFRSESPREEKPDWQRPASTRRRVDDDDNEDDYRPSRRQKRSSGVGLWLGIGVGVAAMIAVAGILIVVILKQSSPGEPGRHFERAGRFSYVPVPGWRIQDIPGLQFKVLMAPPEPGFAPNMNFIPENAPLDIAAYTDANINTLKAMFQDFRLLGKQPFNTNEGLQGFKIIHENTQGNLRMHQCQYFFGNGNSKIVITGTVPVNSGQRYDAMLDACAKSFRFE